MSEEDPTNGEKYNLGRVSPADADLAARVAKLQRSNSAVLGHAAEAAASAKGQLEAIARASEMASNAVRPSLSSQISLENLPERRAARAAEQTTELLGSLVDAALASEARSAAAEKRALAAEGRENRMLELTITNTRISKIAAISSVVSVVVGLIAVIVTVLLA